MEIIDRKSWGELYQQAGKARPHRRDAPDQWPSFLEKNHLFLDQCATIIDTTRAEVVSAKGFDRVFGIPDDDINLEKLLSLYIPSQLEAMYSPISFVVEFIGKYGIRPREDSLLIYCNLRHADGSLVYIERRIFAWNKPEDSRPLTFVNIYQKLDMQYYHDDIRIQLNVPYAQEMIDAWQSSQLQKEGINLTARERMILMSLLRGSNSQEIADNLCLSKNTVDTYRRKLIRKSNAKNTLELICRYGNSPLQVFMM